VQHDDLREALAHDLSVDAIIANPPYVRYHKLGRRKEITNRLNLSMLSGLHSHFLAHSAELLKLEARYMKSREKGLGLKVTVQKLSTHVCS